MMNFGAIKNADVHSDPFAFMLAGGVLDRDEAAQVRNDYPAINKPGYLPLSKLESTGKFKELVEDLQSPELAQILSEKFGVDLTGKPRMVTVRRLSQNSDGGIHRDSRSKILTVLIYLNDTWDGEDAGVLRVLRNGEGFNDYTMQVPPVYGNFFAFLRSDQSWHGHLPFTGERYVVQMAFLTSGEELKRKENRGGLQFFLKKLNPFQ